MSDWEELEAARDAKAGRRQGEHADMSDREELTLREYRIAYDRVQNLEREVDRLRAELTEAQSDPTRTCKACDYWKTQAREAEDRAAKAETALKAARQGYVAEEVAAKLRVRADAAEKQASKAAASLDTMTRRQHESLARALAAEDRAAKAEAALNAQRDALQVAVDKWNAAEAKLADLEEQITHKHLDVCPLAQRAVQDATEELRENNAIAIEAVRGDTALAIQSERRAEIAEAKLAEAERERDLLRALVKGVDEASAAEFYRKHNRDPEFYAQFKAAEAARDEACEGENARAVERDKWKARAEALTKALHAMREWHLTYHGESRCFLCIDADTALAAWRDKP